MLNTGKVEKKRCVRTNTKSDDNYHLLSTLLQPYLILIKLQEAGTVVFFILQTN